MSINVWLVDEDNYSMEDDPNQLIGEAHDEDEDMKQLPALKRALLKMRGIA